MTPREKHNRRVAEVEMKKLGKANLDNSVLGSDRGSHMGSALGKNMKPKSVKL